MALIDAIYGLGGCTLHGNDKLLCATSTSMEFGSWWVAGELKKPKGQVAIIRKAGKWVVIRDLIVLI